MTRRNAVLRAAVIAGLSSLLVPTAQGADWLGTVSGDVNDPSNWSESPSGKNLYIGITGNNGGPAPFRATLSANLAFPIVDLQVARTGGPAIFNHTAGSAATGNGNWVDVGTDGGTGTYNLANTAGVGGTLTGFAQGSGSVTALNTTNDGGRIYVGGVEFGGGGGTGTMNINTSGTVNTHRLIIGEQGTGVVRMDSGTINLLNDMTVGFRTNGANTGNGTFQMSGGTVSRTGGWTTFGRDGGSQGHFSQSGGSVTASGNTIVGLNNATGTFTVSGGTYGAGELHIGRDGNANGTATFSGGTINVANETGVGMNSATGTWTQTGGTLNGGAMWVGNQNNGNGTATISAGAVNLNNWLAVGRDNSVGTLTISGSADFNQGITDATSYTELTNFGLAGTATINMNGGTLTTNGFRHNGNATATSTVNLNGGVVKARNNEANFMSGLTRANVRNGGAIIDSNGLNVTVAQPLEHSSIGGDNAVDGGLTKRGAGTLTVTAAQTYTGPTIVDAGTLVVTGSIATSNSVNVKSGATLDVSGVGGGFSLGATQTLKGDGTVVGAVGTTAGAKISPGQSPGTLTLSNSLDITNAVTPASSAALVFELGTTSDKVVLTSGGLSIGSGVLAFNDFAFSNAGGLAAGTYTLFDTSTPITGTLAGAGLSGTIGGFTGTLGFADGGNDLVLNVAPVPEPAGFALAAVGGLAALLRRRRTEATL